MSITPRRAWLLPGVLILASTLTACGEDSADTNGASEADGEIVVYVGRDEELVAPLIKQFTEDTGIEVEARYAGTSELAATLLEEGDASPADAFLSQDAGALGALADEELLLPLPDEIADAVLPGYTSTDGSWVGVTGRSRVIAYDGEKYAADEVPGTVTELTDPQWEGKVGFPPGNASFQSFVTGFRVAEGDDAARTWLEDMAANDVEEYDSNSLTLEAINTGTLDIGLINHYYWFEAAAEAGEENMRAQLKFADAGDPGALVNVTGAGLLSEDPDAVTFVEYLVSEPAQRYFTETTFEYPLVEGVPTPEGLPSLSELQGPEIDLSDLADLEETVRMIQEAGLS
ncbi:MAG: iron ABC transporter substrate-binding protein [Nocardioides sp.]|nr:iron ABC transporter substrate-binding protein [Nocardioides sp.]